MALVLPATASAKLHRPQPADLQPAGHRPNLNQDPLNADTLDIDEIWLVGEQSPSDAKRAGGKRPAPAEHPVERPRPITSSRPARSVPVRPTAVTQPAVIRQAASGPRPILTRRRGAARRPRPKSPAVAPPRAKAKTAAASKKCRSGVSPRVDRARRQVRNSVTLGGALPWKLAHGLFSLPSPKAASRIKFYVTEDERIGCGERKCRRRAGPPARDHCRSESGRAVGYRRRRRTLGHVDSLSAAPMALHRWQRKGIKHWMAPDFGAPLEEFREYME